MPDVAPALAPIRRILVPTDRSETADRAVRWGAAMAERYGAHLFLLQVVVPTDSIPPNAAEVEAAERDLGLLVEGVAHGRGEARVLVDADPAAAIVRTAEHLQVDVIVVGNAGMAGRRQFLLANVPNRVSHMARCNVVIVNTTDGVLPPVEAPATEESVGVEGHLLGRAARIGRVMARHGVRDVLSPADPSDHEGLRDRAGRLRSAFEELGPTFAKLGQILSTRPDLLPAEFVEELSTLQDRVPPLTEEEVVRVMEEELKVPWEDVFDSIDPAPMAAGTIAQVHRATLAVGERVIVKVQRPTAKRDIEQDLGLLEMFAEKMAERPGLRQLVDLPALVGEMAAGLRAELDFGREAHNLERMGEVLASFPRLDVPRLYRDYCTDRLLVMEEVQGVFISEAPEGEARREAARQLLESYYRQVMAEGFFHADPHPGNLMWWNDKVYFIDLGMVGEVEPETRDMLLLLLMAFWQEDAPFLSDVVLMLSGQDQRSDIDIDRFERELGELLGRYRHASLQDIQLGPILQEITEISVRYGVQVPASLALIGKALAQMQLAVSTLDPALDPFKVAGTFVVQTLTRQLRERVSPRRLFYDAQKARVRLVRLVESIERLAGARPGPRLQVHFRGTEALEQTVRRAGRRIAVAAAAGGALVATALTTGGETAGWVPMTLGAVGGTLTAGLVLDLIRPNR
jgi:predicted unusual protein kinase regulating ubiquinone biosynthesis (AarF/ABC1/UbiB family)/nucleotide-binding universal stress UspA family protein